MRTIQPILLLKIIGYWGGGYVACPNFGLLDDDAVPDRLLLHHMAIMWSPLLVYVLASLAFALWR